LVDLKKKKEKKRKKEKESYLFYCLTEFICACKVKLNHKLYQVYL